VEVALTSDNVNRAVFIPILVLLSVFPVSGQDNIILVTVETVNLDTSAPSCSGQFIAHDLDHITTVPGGDEVRMFEANGGGVGINDLDNDGDLDIVLANHADLNTILWNEGDLNFRTQQLRPGDSRAVTVVDVDGDGLLDVVFSRTRSAPTYLHNNGSGNFAQIFLSGVGKPLYAINWADLDTDGDLDLVGATYDASLLIEYGNSFLTSGDGGVYFYEHDGGTFRLTSLATTSQALALVLVDINHDGHLDIWVGNDFDLPDQMWYWTETGWEAVQPLATMSHSTMSLDFGDVNNDGQSEVFSTDMQPLRDDSETIAAWNPILQGWIDSPLPTGDPQVNANVLQSITDFADTAQVAGVEATGWSWSGKFGDLDQDGFLDLYVVNGFMESTTFAHLPNHELVEPNQVFRNVGDGQFVTMPEWGLGSMRSGRGMSMGDMDGDGDLDIVVNNLRGAAELFENQLCEGSSLQVDLRWPDSGNTVAIGASLVLHTNLGTYYRDVKTASGYISGDPARIHFGFPDDAQLEQLEIRWPDGETSLVDNLVADTLLRVERAGWE
jgi:enediyne biosynthesis protein E4